MTGSLPPVMAQTPSMRSSTPSSWEGSFCPSTTRPSGSSTIRPGSEHRQLSEGWESLARRVRHTYKRDHGCPAENSASSPSREGDSMTSEGQAARPQAWENSSLGWVMDTYLAAGVPGHHSRPATPSPCAGAEAKPDTWLPCDTEHGVIVHQHQPVQVSVQEPEQPATSSTGIPAHLFRIPNVLLQPNMFP